MAADSCEELERNLAQAHQRCCELEAEVASIHEALETRNEVDQALQAALAPGIREKRKPWFD